MNVCINDARKRYKKAAENLCKVVAEQYKAGSTVLVRKGNSTFEAEVISINSFWWSRPGELTVENLSTGKKRKISYDDVIDP